jgi:hypothetical protein
MIYEKEYKEHLGGLLIEYLTQLETQLELKLKEQLNEVITTRGVDYKMTKFLNSNLIEINFGDKRILQLFSPDGCTISGKISIQVQAEMPGTDGNVTRPYNFDVHFDSTNIKYNITEELFSVENNINISYISLNDRHF